MLLLRSTLYGEFMDFSGAQGLFVTLTDISNCIASPPAPHPAYVKDPWANTPPVPYSNPTDISAFCDFAGGIAENVLAIRRGNVMTLKKCWKEHNESAAVGQFIRLFREENLRPEQIWGDNTGAGKVIVSWLEEMGWPIGTHKFATRCKFQKPFGRASAILSSCFIWHVSKANE